MTVLLLLFPVVVGAAACWGVAAHRHTTIQDDQNDYEALKPEGHVWSRTVYQLCDQQRRAANTAHALTHLLAGGRTR